MPDRGWTDRKDNRSIRRLLAVTTSLAISLGTTASAADSPRVLVSIKPIHSLVAAIMQGAGEPALLIGGGASPHTYSLKPSDARALQEADLIFWVGNGLETFLQKPLSALPRKARIVELVRAEGVMTLPSRESGSWEPHGADEQGAAIAHGHDRGSETKDSGKEYKHEADVHIWLDAGNARAMVRAVAAALSGADPSRVSLYQANERQTEARLGQMDDTLRAQLTPLTGRPYIVFHDACQYLEHRYGLTPAGSITASPDRQPSARRIAEMRERIIATHAICIFREPQFEPSLITTLVEGTTTRVGVLDAEGGASIRSGPEAYFLLMQGLGDALERCLDPDR